MDERPKILAENTSIKPTDVMKKLGEAWKESSAETKDKYKALSENEKANENKVDGENGAFQKAKKEAAAKAKASKAKGKQTEVKAKGKGTEVKAKGKQTEGKTKKSKATKAMTETHDAHAIKRPRNPYIIFCIHERERVSKENPGLNGKELMSKLAESWQNATLEITQKYKVLSNVEKETYGKVKHNKVINID
jgi:hypothetical protein